MTAWIMFPCNIFLLHIIFSCIKKCVCVCVCVCVWLGLCIESILAEVKETLWFRLDANTCKHIVFSRLCQHATNTAVFS